MIKMEVTPEKFLQLFGGAMDFVIIVEGKNDKEQLQKVVTEDVEILCTYGTPGTEQLENLRRQIGDRDVYVFTDNDRSGRRIRALLSEAFPDAVQLYTRKGYAGVEGTPKEYMIRQLEKAGLEQYVRKDAAEPGSIDGPD
jgi:toprim domain protein